MKRRRSTLASLLIISAIDLLLCCFTMGIMLFLVLQPSQRSDVGRAGIAEGTASLRPSASIAAGGNAPVVIIVDNIGDNRATPQLPVPGAFNLVSAANADGSGSLVYTVDNPSDARQLLLSSNERDQDSTKTLIAIARSGKLFHDQIVCPHGGDATIDLSKEIPVSTGCSTMELPDQLCNYPQAEPNGNVLLSKISAEDLKLLRISPPEENINFSFPFNVCLLLPVFGGGGSRPDYADFEWFAENFQPMPTSGFVFASNAAVSIVLQYLEASSVTRLVPSCNTQFTLFAGKSYNFLLAIAPSVRPHQCKDVDINSIKESR